jgi:hypothetical protein
MMGNRLRRLENEASAIIADGLSDGGGGCGRHFSYSLDDRAADDCAVGDAGQGGEMFWFGNAETDTDGAIGHGAKLADVLCEIRGQILAGAGDPRNGEIINEARTHSGDFASPLGGGGGGNQ